jgi:hypothetical protein
MKLTKKEKCRLYELELKARDTFIENSDFLPSDWLEEQEAKEWEKLFNKFLK